MLVDAAEKARTCCPELADFISHGGAHHPVERFESAQALTLLETALVRLGLMANDAGTLTAEQAALLRKKVGCWEALDIHHMICKPPASCCMTCSPVPSSAHSR